MTPCCSRCRLNSSAIFGFLSRARVVTHPLPRGKAGIRFPNQNDVFRCARKKPLNFGQPGQRVWRNAFLAPRQPVAHERKAHVVVVRAGAPPSLAKADEFVHGSSLQTSLHAAQNVRTNRNHSPCGTSCHSARSSAFTESS